MTTPIQPELHYFTADIIWQRSALLFKRIGRIHITLEKTQSFQLCCELCWQVCTYFQSEVVKFQISLACWKRTFPTPAPVPKLATKLENGAANVSLNPLQYSSVLMLKTFLALITTSKFQNNFFWRYTNYLILKMTYAQVVKTSVNVISNSPSQYYTRTDHHTLLNFQKNFCFKMGALGLINKRIIFYKDGRHLWKLSIG